MKTALSATIGDHPRSLLKSNMLPEATEANENGAAFVEITSVLNWPSSLRVWNILRTQNLFFLYFLLSGRRFFIHKSVITVRRCVWVSKSLKGSNCTYAIVKQLFSSSLNVGAKTYALCSSGMIPDHREILHRWSSPMNCDVWKPGLTEIVNSGYIYTSKNVSGLSWIRSSRSNFGTDRRFVKPRK